MSEKQDLGPDRIGKSLPHDHSFGQEERRSGERRTLIVIALTATMMVVEIAAGWAFGSMALLADGLHMASHAAALTITAAAYVFARRHAHDERFSFGVGKVNALGGFTGAILLALFALVMAFESVSRLIDPVSIAFDQAIAVAVIGLVVNGVSVWLLGHSHGDDHDHHHDHNLRSAYLHVLADALTSLLAIVALLAGKFFALAWMDPTMGIVGAVLVARWSIGLLRSTGRVLLDAQAPAELREEIRRHLESGEDVRVVDLHVWNIGPGLRAVIVSLVAREPHSVEHYKARLPEGHGLVHVTVEVQPGEGDVSELREPHSVLDAD